MEEKCHLWFNCWGPKKRERKQIQVADLDIASEGRLGDLVAV